MELFGDKSWIYLTLRGCTCNHYPWSCTECRLSRKKKNAVSFFPGPENEMHQESHTLYCETESGPFFMLCSLVFLRVGIRRKQIDKQVFPSVFNLSTLHGRHTTGSNIFFQGRIDILHCAHNLLLLTVITGWSDICIR